MSVTRPRLLVRRFSVVVLLGTSACSSDDPKAVSPAKISNAVPEGQLTTITLTMDAVRRLGITTARVESVLVQATHAVGGEIVVPPGLSLTVTSPVAGTVLAPPGGALPAAGTRVTRGATLLLLAPLPADPSQAERDHDVARARLRQSEAEATRMTQLFAEGLVSARDQERTQAELVTARATAAAALSQLRLVRGGGAGGGVSTLHVAAPSSGVIRAMYTAAGQTVAAGTPLTEVMRTDRLWVKVPIYAGDASRIVRTAQAVVGGLGDVRSGPVIVAVPVAAPPSGDAAAASIDLYYELVGRSMHLQPGERVGVTLVLKESPGERGLVMPLAALVRDLSGGSWAYERKDSVTFIRRRVEISRVAGSLAVLARGLSPGANVVTEGAAELFGTEFGAGK